MMGQTRLLINPSPFTISYGETILITGASEQGKRTWVQLMLGMLNNHQRTVILGGQDIMGMSEMELSEHLHYEPAQLRLVSDGDLRESLFYSVPFDLNRLSPNLLEILGLEGHRRALMPGRSILRHSWSGGELKQLSLLRAALLDRPICVLDEPTESLSTLERNRIWQAIFEIFTERTLVCITYDMSFKKYAGPEARVFEVRDHIINEITTQS